MKVFIIMDLVFGDSGKGKLSSALLEKYNFDYCIKPNGSSNAGHSIVLNGEKIITHLLPAGVLHNVKSIIGPCCVMNVNKFFDEIKYLEEKGFYNCRDLIKVAYNTHIVTEEHIVEDSQDTKIGTTRQGNGPAYRDKYSRTGIRAESIPELQPFLVDMYEELFKKKNIKVLFENGQGYGLDVDHGDYPYVTSSSCGVGAVINSGVPPKSIKRVYGAVKSYVTYVGAKKFQPEGEVFEEIQRVGNEFGATTGRRRAVFWNDIDMINRAIQMNGVDVLVVNKMDILQQVGVWKIIKDGEIIDVKDEKGFKKFMKKNIISGVKVIFSYRPDGI